MAEPKTKEELVESLPPQIAKVLKAFDFEKVYRCMKALDWTWSLGMGKYETDRYGIPSILTMQVTAADLLLQVWSNKKGRICTGGFEAGYDKGDVWLAFVIEDQHSADL